MSGAGFELNRREPTERDPTERETKARETIEQERKWRKAC